MFLGKLEIAAAKVIRSWENTKHRKRLIVLGHITDHLMLVVIEHTLLRRVRIWDG